MSSSSASSMTASSNKGQQDEHEQQQQQREQLHRPKHLEGVQYTEELGTLLKEAIAVANKDSSDDDDDVPALKPDDSDVSTTAAKVSSSLIPLPLSITKARIILLQYASTLEAAAAAQHDDDDDSKQQRRPKEKRQEEQQQQQQPKSIPISVIRSIACLLPEKVDSLEASLSTSSLAFTPEDENDDGSGKTDKEKLRFRQRLQRLRVKEAESQYKTLVHNVGGEQVRAAEAAKDDVTTKSMTYAASIGLNMIVGPISFGVFMYFFAGGLLDYFFPPKDIMKMTVHEKNAPKIGRILVGVISGVMMMFIEMILFVIRTHEMDKAMQKKTKKLKQQSGAFGYYTSDTKKTYKED